MHFSANTIKARTFILAFFCLFAANTVSFADSLVSIIIDDIGNDYKAGKQAVTLQGNLTYALLPNTPYSETLAAIGLKQQKEFMLHLPMQSIDSRLFTADSLHMHMTQAEFNHQVEELVRKFPFIKGINNHMGSLLTLHRGFMQQLMHELKLLGNLYFIDSKTNAKSVAFDAAREQKVPALQRDIFLDNSATVQDINQQFDRLIALSQQQGYAIAICHPHAETIAVLKQRLPQLSKQHIRLVKVSTLLNTIKGQSNEKSTDTLSAGM